MPVVNIEGVAPGAAEADRPRARRHLPRQDQEVERQGDRRAQSGVKLPDETDHRRAPLRRLGHHVHLHRLPVEGEPRVEDEGRREHGGRVAGRRGRQGQRRRRRLRAAHQGLDRLRRVRVREAEQHGARRWCRTRTASIRAAGRRDVPGRRGERRLEQRARLLPDPHQPAGQERPGRSPARASSCCTRSRTSPQNGRGGAEVLRLGVQERREDGRGARLRAAARQPGRR